MNAPMNIVVVRLVILVNDGEMIMAISVAHV